jgi:hypothetical protein
MNIQKQVFNNLMTKLEIKPSETNKDRFNDWMRNKVKSIFYADNEKMTNAFNRVDEYSYTANEM